MLTTWDSSPAGSRPAGCSLSLGSIFRLYFLAPCYSGLSIIPGGSIEQDSRRSLTSLSWGSYLHQKTLIHIPTSKKHFSEWKTFLGISTLSLRLILSFLGMSQAGSPLHLPTARNTFQVPWVWSKPSSTTLEIESMAPSVWLPTSILERQLKFTMQQQYFPNTSCQKCSQILLYPSRSSLWFGSPRLMESTLKFLPGNSAYKYLSHVHTGIWHLS